MRKLSDIEHQHLEKYWYGTTVDLAELYLSDKRPWQCEKGHIWETHVFRVLDGRGCHYCTNRKVLAGFNDLATTHPEVAALWDAEHNTQQPTEMLAGTRTKAAWKCTEGHQWIASIYSRTQGLGCPICSGKQVLTGYNDFATLYPHLADEWSTHNTTKPTEVTAYSSQKITWECEKFHTWKTTVKHRAYGSQCPQCVRYSQTSNVEKEVFAVLSQQFPHYALQSNNRKVLNGKELDIYLPELSIGIEVNGTYWHSDYHLLQKNGKTSWKHHHEKRMLAQDAGILLLYVWELDWKSDVQRIVTSIQDVLQQVRDGVSPQNVVIADALLKLTEDE